MVLKEEQCVVQMLDELEHSWDGREPCQGLLFSCEFMED